MVKIAGVGREEKLKESFFWKERAKLEKNTNSSRRGGEKGKRRRKRLVTRGGMRREWCLKDGDLKER